MDIVTRKGDRESAFVRRHAPGRFPGGAHHCVFDGRREHGLVSFSGERELVPAQLHGIQELNYMVGEFFDRALYHLTRGHEAAAKG